MLPHMAMGSVLGAFGSLSLMITNARLFEMIVDTSSPRLAVLGLVAFSSLAIAVGAAATAFLFALPDKG
jgi:hypothetical protein